MEQKETGIRTVFLIFLQYKVGHKGLLHRWPKFTSKSAPGTLRQATVSAHAMREAAGPAMAGPSSRSVPRQSARLGRSRSARTDRATAYRCSSTAYWDTGGADLIRPWASRKAAKRA
jgi:hypothetical protein